MQPDPYISEIQNYLEQQDWSDIEVMAGREFEVFPLACGEYNRNYLLKSGDLRLVFRVNMASQIDRDDQILYEFRSLKMVAPSGVTPIPYFVDNSQRLLEHGISIMEFLSGEPLDYMRDLQGAARTFAKIHSLQVNGPQHLIVEKEPLSLIHAECSGLLQKYFDSPIADPKIRPLLHQIIKKTDQLRENDSYFQQTPHSCIVNTEVNSGNFIVNRDRDTIWLIDWEMPRWGDPSSDLCHFCSPLTTLWKTDYMMSDRDKKYFLSEYCSHLAHPVAVQDLETSFQLKYPFVLLRGISWSAMAWVAYQTNSQTIRNEDTWKTLNRYMDYDFIHSLFDSYL